ncbi:MAG: hypothetical protein ACD_34C00585G0001 [uncultured bacterium]|nr:MAG: hypothetical protein ACD_34C00585G0001 [uncultured bacterium]HCS38194.1 hypothetical protein [Anaerolineaceae bacterium]
MQENSKWKTMTYIIGGALGLATGVAAAFLFIRAREDSEGDHSITSGQGVKIGLGIVSFLRQITESTAR